MNRARTPAKAMDLGVAGPQTLDLSPQIPIHTAQEPHVRPHQVVSAPVSSPQKRVRKLSTPLKYLAFIAGATALGLLSINLGLGQWAIAAYAVGVLILKVDSRYSFWLGLLALTVIPVFLWLSQDALAENYAVYAFYFLVIGTVAAARELQR